MNLKERKAIFEEIFAECLELSDKKGKDYSGEEDGLANFKLNAESLGITKFQTWAIYFKKGVDAILNSIKASPNDPQVESEPLKERIKDAIIYLVLLYCLMLENEDEEQKGPTAVPEDDCDDICTACWCTDDFLEMINNQQENVICYKRKDGELEFLSVDKYDMITIDDDGVPVISKLSY